MLKPAEGPATIAILGGNPVIGRAPGEARVGLVLPASSSRRQEALLTLIRTTPSTTNLPVIGLTTTANENGHGTRLPRPCSIEDLRRSIDETLQDSVSVRSG
jgi:hypothetical protein